MAKKSKKKPETSAREEILVSLQEEPKHLEELGSRISTARLTQLAEEHLALAREDGEALGKYGFDSHWFTAIEHALADLREQAKGGDHHVPTSPDLEAAVASAEKWISTCLTVAKNSGPRVRKEAPRVSHHDHSPRVLANQVEKLAAFVADHAKETLRHGGGKAFADAGEQLAQALRKIRSEHTVERAAVPAVVQDLHLAAGLVYAELIRLSRAAHDALAPARAKAYAMSSLRMGRHAHGHGHGHAAPSAPTPAHGSEPTSMTRLT